MTYTAKVEAQPGSEVDYLVAFQPPIEALSSETVRLALNGGKSYEIETDVQLVARDREAPPVVFSEKPQAIGVASVYHATVGTYDIGRDAVVETADRIAALMAATSDPD